MTDDAVEARGLVKKFGDFTAVRGVDFHVDPGEIFGFLGPNGGILVAARQRSMEGFQMIMQFLLMPMFFLSGALFPLRGVPLWMVVLAKVDPVTYGVDPLRRVALRSIVADPVLASVTLHPMLTDVFVMLGLGALFLVPAVWLFGRQE
ncbi:MAG TPA: ABC transporter permease [Gemmatimonadota bacterium]|nr:ABC transporter permease [Gemmatimonadota bacterium]